MTYLNERLSPESEKVWEGVADYWKEQNIPWVIWWNLDEILDELRNSY